jgi:uncharacterized protein (TIGR00251 family)
MSTAMSTNETWLRQTDRGILLLLHVQPRASKTEIAGIHGDRLKVRLAAPPVDGEANLELVAYLSRRLAVPKSRIHILRGESGRTKDVLCVDVAIETARSLATAPK